MPALHVRDLPVLMPAYPTLDHRQPPAASPYPLIASESALRSHRGGGSRSRSSLAWQARTPPARPRGTSCPHRCLAHLPYPERGHAPAGVGSERSRRRRVPSSLVAFLRTEAAGGVVREDLGHWVMVVPAALFVAIAGGGEAGRGWCIPMATDARRTAPRGRAYRQRRGRRYARGNRLHRVAVRRRPRLRLTIACRRREDRDPHRLTPRRYPRHPSARRSPAPPSPDVVSVGRTCRPSLVKRSVVSAREFHEAAPFAALVDVDGYLPLEDHASPSSWRIYGT